MRKQDVVEELLDQMLRECPAPPRRANVPEGVADMMANALINIAKNKLRPLARDIVASGVPFIVVDGGKAIMCFTCGLVSHNPNDVEQRYCGACHQFHEQP